MANIISIDGACRRNGKPDCLSAGAVFIKHDIDPVMLIEAIPHIICTHETPSTNQRGELLALIAGLKAGIKLIRSGALTVYFITDSEYIFNAITKEWFKGWSRRGWITADGSAVKNRDLWEQVAELVDRYDANEQMVIYHVKGHVVSIGKATASKLFNEGVHKLYLEISRKYDETLANPLKEGIFLHALELFERNNGFVPPSDIFKEMIICNTISDIAAGIHADKIDASPK